MSSVARLTVHAVSLDNAEEFVGDEGRGHEEDCGQGTSPFYGARATVTEFTSNCDKAGTC